MRAGGGGRDGLDADRGEPVRRRSAVPAARGHAAGAGAGGAAAARARRRHPFAELEESLDALGSGGPDLPARQRGLRAVLEWSVGLLSDAERSLLLALAVFSAGFTTSLAEAAFGDVVDELDALLAAGLVRPADGGRFEVRPPVRRFAAELLDAEDEDAAHAAITDALIALAEPFEKRWVVCTIEGRLTHQPRGAATSSPSSTGPSSWTMGATPGWPQPPAGG